MSGIQNSQIPVFRIYFVIEIRRKNSGPRVVSGGDRIPVLSDSGILKLHCITYLDFFSIDYIESFRADIQSYRPAFISAR